MPDELRYFSVFFGFGLLTLLGAWLWTRAERRKNAANRHERMP